VQIGISSSSITFKADADGDGTGSFSMSTDDQIDVGEGFGAGSNARSLIISGAGVVLGDTQSGSLMVSSSKDIQAQNLRTGIPFNNSTKFGTDGSITLISTGGAIRVQTIKANGGPDTFPGKILIDTSDVFQARGTFNASSSFSSLTDLPASVATPGTISIKHSGQSFVAGIGLERDPSGEVIYRATGGSRAGERVFPKADGSLPLTFADGTVVNASNAKVNATSVPFIPEDVSQNTSYTRGTILIGGGTNATYYNVFQNSVFTPAIRVTTLPKPTLGNGGNSSSNQSAGGVTTNATNSTNPSASTTPTIDSQTVQRQLITQQQNGVCDTSITIASAPPTETRSPNRDRNPCTTDLDNAQILKILKE
jgi:hypothetical protein